ncbi:MAG: hypothetical protein LBQ46_01050 [Treponema sp.]|jgi:hypothetical protein|nr:hypothetical protein [Treponema sp.]
MGVNPNMPLRLLLYIARIYEYLIEQWKKGSLYRERLIKLPFPQFIVLYNGIKPYPDRVTLKLSDCFEAVGELMGKAVTGPALELIVQVYNINQGYNEELVGRSENLKGYSSFIGRVRENRKAMGLEGAMKEAVEYCIAHNILSAFLIKHSTEVKNMLLTEWNIDDAKEVWQEEAREEGREEGRAETVKEVLELIRQGYISEEELRKYLK